MAEKLIGENDLIQTSDGRTMKLSMLRAREVRLIKDRRRNLLKKMPAEKKKDFYYKVIQALDKQTIQDRQEPIFPIALSPYTFMNDTVMVGNFQTTYGQLLSRIHQAIDEVGGDDLDEL